MPDGASSLWKLVHQFGQVAVDGREDGHADGEVAGPEECLSLFAAQTLHVLLVMVHPARRSAHDLHVVAERAQEVAIRRCGVGKLYRHVGRGEGGRVEVVRVVDVYLANDTVAATDGNLLDHVAHFPIPNECYLHLVCDCIVVAYE